MSSRVSGNAKTKPGQFKLQHVPMSCLRRRTPAANRSLDRLTLSGLVFGQLGIGVVACNSGRTITLANSTAKQWAQMEPEGKSFNAAPKIWGEMFDLRGRRIPVQEWPSVRALRGETVPGSECRLVRSDGKSRDVLFGAFPISEEGWQTFGSVSSITDLTEHKKTQRILLEKAVEDDRASIASDIHDILVQGLNATVLQLQTAESEFDVNPEQARQRLHRVCEIARKTLAESRRTMWSLGHDSFRNEDPADALAFLARRLFEGTSMQPQLSLQRETFRLPAGVRDGIVRIAREAMTNVLNHSHATKVRIDLTYREREIRLAVMDNGRGFVPALLSSGKPGFGLLGFQTRAEQLGGRVDVYSRPGRGTRVVARLPLDLNFSEAAVIKAV